MVYGPGRWKGYLAVVVLGLTLALAWARSGRAEVMGPAVTEALLPPDFASNIWRAALASMDVEHVHGGLTLEGERQFIARLEASRAALRAAGRLPEPDATLSLPLIVPYQLAPGAGNYLQPYRLGQLFDHDPAGGSLLDYACGEQTYDYGSYDHAGVDFIAWPFPWNQLEYNEGMVVAAADGVIILKDDTDDTDRSCALSPLDSTLGNVVVIEHANGLQTWYGHMKYNSLTAKEPGDFVQQGEMIGIVGSSGVSPSPHLHFEVRDPNREECLSDSHGDCPLDPFAGLCNLNNPDTGSLWQSQPLYVDSGINRMVMGYETPQIPLCELATINENTVFNKGDRVWLTNFYRDLVSGQTTFNRIYRPDGTLWTSWEWTYSTGGAAKTWYKRLPFNAAAGEWMWESTLVDQTYSYTFTVLP